MIKSELVLKIAETNPHLYQRDVENIVNAILDEISGAMSRGDRVELRGFGAFSVKERPARVGRNPHRCPYQGRREGGALLQDRQGHAPAPEPVVHGEGTGMKRFVLTLVFAPIAILVLLFAVANRQLVALSLDPFNAAAPALTFRAPLFLVLFAVLMVGVVVGGRPPGSSRGGTGVPPARRGPRRSGCAPRPTACATR